MAEKVGPDDGPSPYKDEYFRTFNPDELAFQNCRGDKPHIVPFEGLYEGFGHPIGFRTVGRCRADLKTEHFPVEMVSLAV